MPSPDASVPDAADPVPESQAHAVAADEVVTRLATDAEHGLSTAEADRRLERHGPNRLKEAPPIPAWRRFAAQFQELVIAILIVAALISGVVGEWADTLAILAIVLLNGVLGFLQEERANRALAALQRLSSPMARVIRDGQHRSIPAGELVLGDRIDLEAGDHIPADCRLLHGFSLRVQEAALTGESAPVGKDPAAVLEPATSLGDRSNMAYMGTVVAAGKAAAVVVATGMETELGRIAGLLQRSEPQPTPLQRRLAELGKVLVFVCLAAVTLIFAVQLLRGDPPLEAFLLAVSLAVAAVPEGLPAVVTLALAIGLQRMVRRNALVRKLPSVETLGSVTVICSDKTGTLTRNEMTVREVLAGDRSFRVTGAGYAPRGEFHAAGGDADVGHGEGRHRTVDEAPAVDLAGEADLRRLLAIGARCNNAQLYPLDGDNDTWQVVGDPTEGALIVAAMKAEIAVGERDRRVLFEIPFDSDRKAMSVVVRDDSGKQTLFTKGAPEVVLGKSVSERVAGAVVPLTDERRGAIMKANTAMAGRALRVLAMAERPLEGHPASDFADAEAELTFVGLVGMIDPPRDEVRDAIHRCREAGIRPVMITGDHPETAMAIARELRMAHHGDRAVTGRDLDAMTDEQLAAEVDRIAVYARASAEEKLRIVRAWKSRGQIVAMTGDGVNDAPAVKSADIGIAMGLAGTDVTKEAADMVLTDDNFASIVNAVEEGRGIFDNIQKFVHYLLSCNAGEVMFMLFAVLVGWPAPLTAIQLLWINLVTDGLPALALGMEPPERDIMRRRPRPPKSAVISRKEGLLIFLHGLLIAGATAIGFSLTYGEGDLAHARGVALCIMAYSQLFFSLACRSQTRTMPELGLFSNPYLFVAIAISGLLQLSIVTLPGVRPFFDVTGDPVRDWLLILLLSLTPVTLIELGKLVGAALRRRRHPRPAHEPA